MSRAAEAESSWASFQFSISLQVRHPRRSTDDLSKALGLRPGRAWVAGEPRTTPAGTPLEGVYRNSYCYYRLASGVGPIALASRLRRLTRRLAGHSAVLRRWRRSGGTLHYYVFNRATGAMGFTVGPELLSEMARLGIELGVEFVQE